MSIVKQGHIVVRFCCSAEWQITKRKFKGWWKVNHQYHQRVLLPLTSNHWSN